MLAVITTILTWLKTNATNIVVAAISGGLAGQIGSWIKSLPQFKYKRRLQWVEARAFKLYDEYKRNNQPNKVSIQKWYKDNKHMPLDICDMNCVVYNLYSTGEEKLELEFTDYLKRKKIIDRCSLRPRLRIPDQSLIDFRCVLFLSEKTWDKMQKKWNKTYL